MTTLSLYEVTYVSHCRTQKKWEHKKKIKKILAIGHTRLTRTQKGTTKYACRCVWPNRTLIIAVIAGDTRTLGWDHVPIIFFVFYYSLLFLFNLRCVRFNPGTNDPLWKTSNNNILLSPHRTGSGINVYNIYIRARTSTDKIVQDIAQRILTRKNNTHRIVASVNDNKSNLPQCRVLRLLSSSFVGHSHFTPP